MPPPQFVFDPLLYNLDQHLVASHSLTICLHIIWSKGFALTLLTQLNQITPPNPFPYLDPTWLKG
jgi:hypothetical protein